MAELDISKTVNNILSGGGDAAQKFTGKVIKTAEDMAALPDVDVAKLPGITAVSSLVSGTLGAPKREVSKPVPKSVFSQFDMTALHGAVVMASQLMEIADRKGGDAGLADAIGALGSLGGVLGEVTGLAGDLASDLTAEVNELVAAVGAETLSLLGLRQYALMLFITHYAPAREQFKVAPLEQRQPNLVRRSGARATPPEDLLSYWREDAQLNEHHGHWHIVYPPVGRPVAGGDPDMGDRHGELFVYMHEQMLARYDAERLGVGLSRVTPFDDYRAPMPEGYDPGGLTDWLGDRWMTYSARPAGVTLSDLAKPAPDFTTSRPGSKLQDMERFRDALSEAANRGHYEIAGKQIALTSDNFGDTEEANPKSADFPDKKNPGDPKNGANYGNHHNDGHIHFAWYNNTAGPPGVMMNTDSNVRDPIFWRWHKHVDDIVNKWRNTLGKQAAHDFTDGPAVTIRNEDIIICREEGLPAEFDGAALGTEAFGYSDVATKNRWDTDFSSGTVTLSNGTTVTTTDELITEMRTRIIEVNDTSSDDTTGKGKKVPEEIDYLSHEDFFYFIRLQNRSEQAQQVTIRIFLAPEPWIEDITAWIELDRFLYRLAGSDHVVIYRPARLSAVIRKPALGHKELEGTEPRPPATTWCDCGWPYNLLLPRGTKEGLDFQLLVMLSKDDLSMTDTSQDCTSVSYCGLQDKEYPDKRPMGYPFDRSMPDSISSIIEKYENWASRTIRIRCRNL